MGVDRQLETSMDAVPPAVGMVRRDDYFVPPRIRTQSYVLFSTAKRQMSVAEDRSCFLRAVLV